MRGGIRLYFYPRPPRGGRRLKTQKYTTRPHISIHALREEGDCLVLRLLLGFLNFYPRPPRGGRLFFRRCLHCLSKFLSTPSARRATPSLKKSTNTEPFLSTPSARRATIRFRDSSTTTKISIHALREEGDRHNRKLLEDQSNFYPRPPRGGRRMTSSFFTSAP